jgi:hypothetical protein
MKINFELGPNAHQAVLDEILKFWPMQTSTTMHQTEIHSATFSVHHQNPFSVLNMQHLPKKDDGGEGDIACLLCVYFTYFVHRMHNNLNMRGSQTIKAISVYLKSDAGSNVKYDTYKQHELSLICTFIVFRVLFTFNIIENNYL